MLSLSFVQVSVDHLSAQLLVARHDPLVGPHIESLNLPCGDIVVLGEGALILCDFARSHSCTMLSSTLQVCHDSCSSLDHALVGVSMANDITFLNDLFN